MPTSTRSQSPTPNPKATSRKPRTAAKPNDSVAGVKKQQQSSADMATGRAGSAGGIVLEREKEQQAKGKGKATTTASKAASSSSPATSTPTISSKDATAATPKASDKPDANSTGPNRQRRRPRKLNKEPLPEDSTAKPASVSTPPTTTTTASTPVPSAAELEALKSRVRGLEAKVEELYNTSSTRTSGRSPRRRGKGRKGSSATQVPTVSSIEQGKVEELGDEEEADEELLRAEDELENARRDLELYNPSSRGGKRPRGKRTTSQETEYIEEIPRNGRNSPGVEEIIDNEGRQVTLSGSYRIPLPSSVSMDDVKTIQSGVSAAQNVARSFLEQRRARQAAASSQNIQDPPPTPAATPKAAPKAAPKARPTPKAKAASTSTAIAKTDEVGGKQTWGEWFGGYSMAVSRAVKNIEAEAAIESQKAAGGSSSGGAGKRPTNATRGSTASSSAKNTAGAKPRAAGAKGGQRPSVRSKGGNLSSEQVHGLMS